MEEPSGLISNDIHVPSEVVYEIFRVGFNGRSLYVVNFDVSFLVVSANSCPGRKNTEVFSLVEAKTNPAVNREATRNTIPGLPGVENFIDVELYWNLINL
jgi:hypothetical protein